MATLRGSPSIASSAVTAATALPGAPHTPPSVLLLPSLPGSQPQWLADWVKVGRGTLVGYQLWAVEQRVTDRDAILPVVVVFTGDKKDAITVDSFVPSAVAVPSGSTLAPSESQLWVEAKAVLKSVGARISNTSEGALPITALPALPAGLSVVQIPGGEYGKHLKMLYLNINLRRLGFGGRSGLRLADATPTTQIHFHQTYRLPLPTVSNLPSTIAQSPTQTKSVNAPLAFAEVLLELVKLVQNSLALSGLGCVSVPGSTQDGGIRSSSIIEGDGLLCDATVVALNLFRVEIAEPLLRIITPEEPVLSPMLLAALLSIVVSTRGKLIALGFRSVPKDPFHRRAKFLRAFHAFLRTQHRGNDESQFSPFLDLASLSLLSTTYNRSKPTESSRAKVTKAIRGRIDASIQLVDSSSNYTNLPLSSHKTRGEDLETSNLESLVREFERGVGEGGTIGWLWAGKERRGREKRRGEEADVDRDTGGTTSEGEKQGFGRGVLQGVRARAGRAGRRLKFTDMSPAAVTPQVSPNRNLASSVGPSLGPSLLLPPYSSERPGPSRQSSFSIESLKSSAAPRFVSSLATEREEGKSRFDSTRLSPSVPTRPPSAYSSAGEQSASSLGLGLPTRLQHPGTRRTVSEMIEPTSVTPSATIEGKGLQQYPHRRRRHSVNLINDAPKPFQILSRKRLEMDVNLRMAVWDLREREQKLSEMVEALLIIKSSYTQAITSLEIPLQSRTRQLADLTETANTLSLAADAYKSATSPAIAHLSSGASRIIYAQSVLEDKLADIVEFQHMCIAKVGADGTLEVGTRGLGKERSGMRRLVGSLEMWGEFLRTRMRRRGTAVEVVGK